MLLNSKGRCAGTLAEQLAAYNGRHRLLRPDDKRRDKQGDAHRRRRNIRHTRQLAERTVADNRCTGLDVAAVRHVVGTVHTRHTALGHQFMPVAQCQHKHRHKHGQQHPCCHPAPQPDGRCRSMLSLVHSACKDTLSPPISQTAAIFFNNYSHFAYQKLTQLPQV